MTGDIPSFKLFESEKVLAFLDIQPLSRGHAVCQINIILIKHMLSYMLKFHHLWPGQSRFQAVVTQISLHHKNIQNSTIIKPMKIFL